ncbi:Phage integrase family protein [Shimia sp. SK013]|uniref:tyrosine-type recombinase/integrase n=1 Tax=Shimia sp. SK013 TaxID=1389006 RepID=UPI0006B5CF21|nr:tyrosine-type recombinase/integrase [Shimia sp. SK013]KPA22699.1 Phage integrase family protein [Shimia sp. SK013]
MSKSYLNKVELRDGQIILFHRQNAKKPIYHMRIHVRGMRDVYGNKLTYVQESTGETDLEEAKRYALDKYDDLRLRTKKKEPVKQLSFEDLYVIWWADKRQRLEANHFAKGRSGVPQRVGWYEKHAQRYWLAYFGSMKLEEMTQAFVQGYWTWRMTYWVRADEQERKRHPNHAVQPAKKSMDMEQSALREIFGWANSMKLLSHMPIIENPFARKGIAPNRRPSFSAQEFKRLDAYLNKWVEGRGGNDTRVNSAHKFNRQLLQCYIHFLAGTGMRTGEVLQLKHKHVRVERSEVAETQYLKISVPKNTKTGERIVSSQSSVVAVYRELRELTGHTDAEDWVFCYANGKKNEGFYKTLPKMLDEIGLLYDEHGQRRTAYSLRHYYAEQRFVEHGYNAAVYDMLCTNMGTSRQQIEDHYVRKGIMMDVDVLIGGGDFAHSNVATTGGTERERAQRKLDAMQEAAKRRR